MEFCNLNVNITNKQELFKLDSNKPKCIVTLNAQIIRLANTNKELFDFINNNYSTIDGQIPLFFARRANKKSGDIEKLPGSEIVYDFCEYAKKNNMKMFFLGGKEDSNIQAVKNVREKYGIEVDGYSPDFEEYPFSQKFVDNCFKHLEQFKPDIVFIGFGSPKQELFMRDNIEKLKECGVKYAIGSGGTVDFVSKKIKRAPKIISKIGLESVYRLAKEFNIARIKRITYSFGFFKYIHHKPTFKKDELDKQLCALIMAGGVGSRFWPKSTNKSPKQFLALINNKTMLQITYERINKLIPKEKIFVVTNYDYIDIVKEQIQGIKDINIIIEPCSKSTGPCVLLSALYIKNIYKKTNIVCISSDSYIQNESRFIDDINCANEFVNNNNDAIVTIGIKPTRPETGYGYIRYEESESKVRKVRKFVEKPNIELARKYIESNQYLWNAGMFIFNIDSILKEFQSNIPNEYELLSKLPNYNDKKYFDELNKNYKKCTKISIDYAVMEKSNHIYTIPTDIGWDDIGTWKSLERYLPKDSNNNVYKGDIKTINSCNNIIYGNNKKIILLNVDNIFCIDTDDIIIVGNKEDLEKVYTLKDIMYEKKEETGNE